MTRSEALQIRMVGYTLFCRAFAKETDSALLRDAFPVCDGPTSCSRVVPADISDRCAAYYLRRRSRAGDEVEGGVMDGHSKVERVIGQLQHIM
jgi:hypothetical protein